MSQTAAFRIFHSWWGFLLPHYATISKYATKHIGLYLPEDKKAAAGILGQDTYAAMTIAQAAEYAKEGGSIKVNDPKDGIIIYEIVMQHLVDWFDYMKKGSLIERQVPIEDLRVLAAFAEKIFPVANRYGYHAKLVEGRADNMFDSVSSMFSENKEAVNTVRYNYKLIASIEALYRRRNSNHNL